ncbi:MAG: hypothetical protein HY328_17820 [Chloroflexi bacterium]|nr:hypothetical protein [Chloroflexota bacterium]
MTDLVLDVGALADLLAQTLTSNRRDAVRFHSDRFIPSPVVKVLNHIVRSDGRYVVVASAFAFIELAHKWDEIVQGRFQARQLAAFLADPPDWFVVAAMERALIRFLCDVPSEVVVSSGRLQPIEWTDAIHAATTFSREEARLVTTDLRLRQIPNLTAS